MDCRSAPLATTRAASYEDAELLAAGRAAQGDRAEDVENILHAAAPGRQVILDDDAGRRGADRARPGSAR